MTLAEPASFDLGTLSKFSAVLLDLPAIDGDGLAIGRRIRRERESMEFLAIVGEERHGVDAIRSGAFDYLAWPPREPANLWTLVGALLDRVGPPRRGVSGSVGGFSLIRHLGAGGMADVFLAQRAGEEPLVVKCMRSEISGNEGYVRMFMDEARVSQALMHPNIVRLVEFGGTESELYIAMEYVPGKNLAEIGKSAGWRFPPGIACFIAAEVAAALDYAHSCIDEKGAHVSLIHRDVNPPNVLVRDDGAVKLADFGIAKTKQHHSQTTQGTVRGKLEYMSPEQVDAVPLDARTDVFSLGSLLYLLLTGEHPFQSVSTIQTLRRIRAATPEPPSVIAPGLPAALDRIVMLALKRDRDERYASAGALESDLRAWLAENGNASQSDVARFVDDVTPGKAPVPGRATGAVTVLAPPPMRTSEKTTVREPDPAEATITSVAAPVHVSIVTVPPVSSEVSVERSTSSRGTDDRSTSSPESSAENTVTASAAEVAVPVAPRRAPPPEAGSGEWGSGWRDSSGGSRPTTPAGRELSLAERLRRVPEWGWAAGAAAVIVVALLASGAGFGGGTNGPKPVATPLARPVVTLRPVTTPLLALITATPATPLPTPVRVATPPPTPRFAVTVMPVRPTPLRKGTISIWVTDGWAAVSIDGRSLGLNAPVVGLEITEGKHRVTLENAPMKIRRDYDVTVAAGEEFRLNASLR